MTEEIYKRIVILDKIMFYLINYKRLDEEWKEIHNKIENMEYFCQNDHVSRSKYCRGEYVMMHTPQICERNYQPCYNGDEKLYYNECEFYGCNNKCECGGPCLLISDGLAEWISILHDKKYF